MGSSDLNNIAKPGFYEVVQNGNVVGTLRCEGASQEWQLTSSYVWPGRDDERDVATTFRRAAAASAGAPSDTRITVTCENQRADAFPTFERKHGEAMRQIDPGFEMMMQGGAMVGLVLVGDFGGQRVEHWLLSSASAPGVAPFTPIGETDETTIVFRVARSSTNAEEDIAQSDPCAAFLALPGLVHLKAPCLTQRASALGTGSATPM